MARGVWVDRCGDRGSTASCESEWESILVGTNKVAFSGYKMQSVHQLKSQLSTEFTVVLGS